MTDQRRVCDLNPGELLDAALAGYAALGWDTGRWVIELHVDSGRVRRAVPTAIEARPVRVTVGRRQLERPGHGELDSAA